MTNKTDKLNLKFILPAVLFLTAAIAVYVVSRMDTTGRQGSGLGEPFSYDLRELKKINPALFLFKKTASFNTDSVNPSGLAIDRDNRFYIAGSEKVIVYDESGTKLNEFAVAGDATCIALNEKGTIYVGINDEVHTYTPDGKEQARWERLGEQAILTAIAPGETGTYVADAGHKTVWMYDADGNLSGRLEKDPDDKVFVLPSPYFDMAFDSDNDLHVVNPGSHRIEEYRNGTMTGYWGTPSSGIEGFCGCCNPVHLAITQDDQFITSEKGLTRIKLYDRQGRFLGVVAGPEQFPEHDIKVNEKRANRKFYGLDVAVDRNNRVVVLDSCTGMVTIFTRKQDTESL